MNLGILSGGVAKGHVAQAQLNQNQTQLNQNQQTLDMKKGEIQSLKLKEFQENFNKTIETGIKSINEGLKTLKSSPKGYKPEQIQEALNPLVSGLMETLQQGKAMGLSLPIDPDVFDKSCQLSLQNVPNAQEALAAEAEKTAALERAKDKPLGRIKEEAYASQAGQAEASAAYPQRTGKSAFSPSLGRQFIALEDKQGNIMMQDDAGILVPAPKDAYYVSTQSQGTPGELGLTSKVTSNLQTQLINDQETILQLKRVIGGLKKHPSAAGIVGLAKETAAGLVGQFGDTGQMAAEMIESKDEQQVRVGVRMLTGQIIPRVLGDESGRYSDADMKRVQEINSGLKATTSSRQAITYLEEVLDIYERGTLKTQQMLREGSVAPGKSPYSNLWGDE